MNTQLEKIEKFFSILTHTKTPAFDVETNGLDWKKCYVCGYSISDGRESVYIPVRHEQGGNIDRYADFEQSLMVAVTNHTGKIIGHNIKFDAHFSENHGVRLGNKLVDTMTMEALIDENQRSYSLENVAKRYPDIPQKKGHDLYRHIAEMVGCQPNSKSMAHFHRLNGEDPVAVEYAESDTLATYHLYDRQRKHLYAQELEVVADLENKLTYTLQKMERKGVKIDLEEAERAKKEIQDLHIEAYQQIPLQEDLSPVNVRSSKDLKEYFEHCDITDWPYTDPTERYPEGQPSFKADFLGKNQEGIVILNARKLDHIINSFVEPFENFIHNGRIHTNFNQSRSEFGGAKPGRLSSYGPNMQQVPKRDKQLGKIFRKMFVPDDNYVLIEYDYSQAEPRLYAHYSNEPILIEGYNKTPFVDMHAITAEMMGISRESAKSLNLGIMYAMGSEKLSISLGISIEQAKAIIRRWYQTFRNVSSFTRRAADVAEQRGYVKTILGRRARFPDPRWAYRAANRIIQGGSADILKWKMVEIDRWIEKNNYEDVVHMLLNIHDSIVFQIHKDYVHLIDEIKIVLESVQGSPFNLKVPFVMNYNQGNNWAVASYG